MLVLSMHDELIYAERLLAAGASGYIMKHAASDQLLVALRRVLAGEIYLSEALSRSHLRACAGPAEQRAGAAPDPIDRLSNRELQVLSLIGRGLSSREAAEALGLSVKTVETHRQSLKRKLNLATNAQLLQYAINWYANRSKPAALSGRRAGLKRPGRLRPSKPPHVMAMAISCGDRDRLGSRAHPARPPGDSHAFERLYRGILRAGVRLMSAHDPGCRPRRGLRPGDLHQRLARARPVRDSELVQHLAAPHRGERGAREAAPLPPKSGVAR